MVVVSHLFLFYGKISGADVTWYESHLPLFGTIYFPIAPFIYSAPSGARFQWVKVPNPP